LRSMNIRKHASKILVFMVNLLLMVVAILVIKEKDEAKKANQAQDNLTKDNSTILNENENLKQELESLKGVLQEIGTKIGVPEKLIVPDVVAPPKPSSNTKKNNASSGTSSSSSSSSSASNTSSSNNSASSSNSQTKTS